MGYRRNKFNATRVVVDGLRFDSKREAARWQELKHLEKAGRISRLTRQVPFTFEVDGRPVLIRSKGYPNGRRVSYVADFCYVDDAGALVVEDSKGMDTPVSRLKRGMVEAFHGIRVVVV